VVPASSVEATVTDPPCAATICGPSYVASFPSGCFGGCVQAKDCAP
jgi:hypothetical protein